MMEANSKKCRRSSQKGDKTNDKIYAQIPIIDSALLFGGRNELVVRHGESLYRLRITKSGKLIMNK